MDFPKLVVASYGRETAILLDGKMIGPGVETVELHAEGATATLNITGIDVAHFRFGDALDFKKFCEIIAE